MNAVWGNTSEYGCGRILKIQGAIHKKKIIKIKVKNWEHL